MTTPIRIVWPVSDYGIQSERIHKQDGIASRVAVEINTSIESDRVFGDEPPSHRIIVPRPIVIQARPVVLPTRELEGAGGRETGDGGLAEGGIRVRGGEAAATVGERDGTAERIGQIGERAAGIRAAQRLIDTKRPQVARLASPAVFFDDVEAIVEDASTTTLSNYDPRERGIVARQ
jgi:hypothetical protein